MSFVVLSNYNVGWRKELARYPGMQLEYVPLDIMWKAARYAGMTEHYPHFFAKSGYFAFFAYDLDRFWVFDLFRLEVVENALAACNVRRAALEPQSLEEAIGFMREMIQCGNLVWMSWLEPVLVYGVEGSRGNEMIHWHNPSFAPSGTTWGRDELEGWWNWSSERGAHLLVAPVGVSPGQNPEEKIVEELAKLAVQSYRTEFLELGEVRISFGLRAYAAYADDLKNPEVDFLVEDADGKRSRTAWFCFAIYSQWTQTFAAHCYFSHIASFFPERQRSALEAAAQHFGNAYGHWLEWQKIIGKCAKKEEFFERVRDMNLRVAASREVLAAREDVEKAVASLEEFLAARGVSPEQSEQEER